MTDLFTPHSIKRVKLSEGPTPHEDLVYDMDDMSTYLIGDGKIEINMDSTTNKRAIKSKQKKRM